MRRLCPQLAIADIRLVKCTAGAKRSIDDPLRAITHVLGSALLGIARFLLGRSRSDRYLRRILVVGAHSVLRRAKQNPEKYPWLTQLLARRPFKVVAVALANKMARIAWALLARGGTYRVPALAAA